MKKRKKNNILIGKEKNMLENSEFEQDHFSRTAIGFYKNGNDSIRLMNWLADYDRSYYEIVNYYDLMGSVLKNLNEIF